MGGRYEPDNVIRVSVAMHAALHKDLWEHYGKRNDFNAWHMLSGLIGKPPRKQTAETRDKLRIARLGTHHTAETRAKVALASTGRLHTADTKAKIRASHLGVKKTDEHRAKLSAASKANWQLFSAEKKARILAAQEAGRQRNRAARVH